MWAAIQILFYLGRDTLHRWVSRISSPMARISVVFFLSVCGLVFLSNYVVSLKLLRQRIHRNGADLVIAVEMHNNSIKRRTGHSDIPPQPDAYNLYLFNESFTSATVGTQHYSVVEYMPGCSTLFPATKHNNSFVLPSLPCKQMLPEKVSIEGYPINTVTIPENQARILRRLFQSGAVFIPYGSLNSIWQHGFIRRSVLQIKNLYSSVILQHENALKLLAKLDKRNLNIMSSGKLLEELAEMEKTQYSFRVWITVGISSIICMLLTCISSLEFRQSSHVYALIGSFGVSRFLLYLCFLIENTILVAAGFVVSLVAVWSISDFITRILYKSPDINLSLWELENDIRTFLLAFGICIAVSSIPVGIAASRPIGKVLK